jgi:hypothetical protein
VPILSQAWPLLSKRSDERIFRRTLKKVRRNMDYKIKTLIAVGGGALLAAQRSQAIQLDFASLPRTFIS